MNWIDVTHWILVAIMIGHSVAAFMQILKLTKENPQDHLLRRILWMEMWIRAVAILVFMEKITVVLWT